MPHVRMNICDFNILQFTYGYTTQSSITKIQQPHPQSYQIAQIKCVARPLDLRNGVDMHHCPIETEEQFHRVARIYGRAGKLKIHHFHRLW